MNIKPHSLIQICNLNSFQYDSVKSTISNAQDVLYFWYDINNTSRNAGISTWLLNSNLISASYGYGTNLDIYTDPMTGAGSNSQTFTFTIQYQFCDASGTPLGSPFTTTTVISNSLNIDDELNGTTNTSFNQTLSGGVLSYYGRINGIITTINYNPGKAGSDGQPPPKTQIYSMGASPLIPLIPEAAQSMVPLAAIFPLYPPTGTILLARVSVPYGAQFSAKGLEQDPSGFDYTITGLPPGLSLGLTTGLLSGTPSTTGTYFFQVTAAKIGWTQGAYSASVQITLVVSA